MHRKTNNKSARGNTYRQRLTRGLLALGYTQIKNTHWQYEIFQKGDNVFHVGLKGALRSGKIVSVSYSVGEPCNQTTLYKSILKAGEAQASQTPPTPC